MAQLLEYYSHPTPEARGSNTIIGEIYIEHCFLSMYRKEENKEKEAGNGPFDKTIFKLGSGCAQLLEY